MEKEPITVSGLQNLKAELEDLKNIQRPKIVEAIAEARSHGDLKENAEYHAAKEQQALIESRVIAINDIIARANVIDVTQMENDGKVIFGSTVKVQDLETDKKISYRLVGQDEADIKKNLIFNYSGFSEYFPNVIRIFPNIFECYSGFCRIIFLLSVFGTECR